MISGFYSGHFDGASLTFFFRFHDISMDPIIVTHDGPSVYSDYRRKALAKRIGAQDVEAVMLHVVALNGSVTNDGGILDQLLPSNEMPKKSKRPGDSNSRYDVSVSILSLH